VKLATLTKPEWAVMSALWEKSPLTMSGIIAAMGDKMDWKYNTYATYVKRLCTKGFIGYNVLGRDNFYYPAVKKEECIMAESKSLIEKISDRSAKALLVCMLKDAKLSQKDCDELTELIGQLKKENS
jgi:BlaI family penicillinase repressor